MADPKRVTGTHAGANFFNFHAVLRKKTNNRLAPNLWGWRLPGLGNPGFATAISLLAHTTRKYTINSVSNFVTSAHAKE